LSHGKAVSLTSVRLEETKMESQTTSQWQVTCQCGWRTHGTKDAVVVSVQEHARSAHGRELTEDQVMAQATPVSA
jgi:predicted small metal-binding protein